MSFEVEDADAIGLLPLKRRRQEQVFEVVERECEGFCRRRLG